MATLTIRNLPDDLVQRIKVRASANGHSMEQEVKQLLETRYALRETVISRIHDRWSTVPNTSLEEANQRRENDRQNELAE
ncbi:hypothetical protein PN498_14405 [Oscillatoria sp. CS-180]|uniref:FitA-like ribbon-helix-helix domain-containing protein n=1 Tax=Oscillatoria sp. CS-180 TaxID=3021720 RepID=UPI00232D726E|nr:hypothetical protein [Oscillatoria sp. CS-180]MDB9527189.1 hypothetical protein [Oscillatoria sp. CS-180]